jgi:hypothetical protein
MERGKASRRGTFNPQAFLDSPGVAKISRECARGETIVLVGSDSSKTPERTGSRSTTLY